MDNYYNICIMTGRKGWNDAYSDYGWECLHLYGSRWCVSEHWLMSEENTWQMVRDRIHEIHAHHKELEPQNHPNRNSS